MTSPLDTIEYLARSEHRLAVLEALRADPHTRGELREVADASRVTVGRTITDLEDRGWIVRDGKRYTITPHGRYIAREFTRLKTNLSALDELPPVYEWFPGDEPDFELARLRGASVITATERDLIAPLRRALELIETADELRAAANKASQEFVKAMCSAVEDGSDQTLLLPAETVAALRSDPSLGSELRAGIDAGLTLMTIERTLPIIQIADDRVALCSGDHEAMVETDDDAVRRWAEVYFSNLLDGATRVTADRFAPDDAQSRAR